MNPDRAARLWEIFLHSLWPMLQGTLRYTLPLTIVSFALALPVALAVALAARSRRRTLRYPARFYVWIIRGTPVLVQLYLIFYGLPNVGIVLPAFPTVVLAFTIAEGAYGSEIVRSAIDSVPRGQWRAGYSLGMTGWQAFRRIVMPQAVRVSLPPLGNQFIGLLKTSSLAALVTLQDLFGVAKQIAATTFEPMLLYVSAGLYYLAISTVLAYGQRVLERRFRRYEL
ncbi:amino acid ABC transporter permease [Cohnella sp. AR92]|uniref:amino acid ABC transporter permease n=1 Tax=Cohnella sp. AR92 TaxID=648716 RepID=UPI000F8C8CD0|nr:amino acid ABC transporter permease [Cohnella sp. AR92]RUS48537.1 amino acid ABC transporter permease [Cohnella sp. AR92]